MTAVCSVDGCERKVHGRGWCNKHYKRWSAHGDPAALLIARHEGDVQRRFWAKVDKTETCWNWCAAIIRNGYGSYLIAGNKTVLAHRFSYELSIGPIPDGMEIDHRCHNRRCVNPDHLRTVSHKQNAENHQGGARSDSGSGIRGVHRSGNRWRATVRHHNKQIHVGYFGTSEEADLAVRAKRNELFTSNDMDRVSL